MALVEAAESLMDFPERGRLSRPGRRELATIWPYIIRYRVARDHVLILRVRHGRRRPG
jgi:toxin ParE1/3/4